MLLHVIGKFHNLKFCKHSFKVAVKINIVKKIIKIHGNNSGGMAFLRNTIVWNWNRTVPR